MGCELKKLHLSSIGPCLAEQWHCERIESNLEEGEGGCEQVSINFTILFTSFRLCR
jgi:hypothetical protein